MITKQAHAQAKVRRSPKYPQRRDWPVLRTRHKLLEKELADSLDGLQKTLPQFLHQQFASARMLTYVYVFVSAPAELLKEVMLRIPSDR
jgi:hypothetical protein